MEGSEAASRWPGRVANGFVAVVVAAALALTYLRLFYGVDITDQSYYVAVPYHLIRGAHVFVDDTAVAQGFVALLVYPFFRAYYGLFGLTGIILFARHLQFVFSLAVACAVFVSVRAVVGTRRAVLVSTAAVVFVPFNIHGASYNTLGCGFFTAGCFVDFACLGAPDARTMRVLAVLCLGLAVLCYPPLVAAAVVALALRLRLSEGRARRATLLNDLPAFAVPLLAMASVVLAAGLHRVIDDDRIRAAGTSQGNLGGLTALVRYEWHHFDHPADVLLVAVVLTHVAWKVSRVAALALLVVLVPLAAWEKVTYIASLEFVGRLGWFAPALYLLVRKRPFASHLMLAVWVPALVAGATTGFSSSNNGLAFGIGFFPAAIVATTVVVLALEHGIEPVDRVLSLLAPATVSDACPVQAWPYRTPN